MVILIKIKSKLLNDALCRYVESVSDIEILSESDSIKSTPDIVVTDIHNLTEDLVNKYSKSKFLLLDTGIKNEDLVFCLIKYKLKGIFSYNFGIEQFIKALKVIAQGQTWISNNLVQALINREFGDENKIGKIKFTEKESEIIQYVCEGLSNKEIAKKLFISEQTVKSHLHKIFAKLDIKNRSQLIKLYIYNSR